MSYTKDVNMAVINDQLKEIKNIEKLLEIEAPLRLLVIEVAKVMPIMILTGHRGEAEQNKAFLSGQSKIQYPNGKHNKAPSQAVDFAPIPLNWSDTKKFYFFGGYVLGIANKLGIAVKWGGDWDSDTDLNDQTFFDLVHFELK